MAVVRRLTRHAGRSRRHPTDVDGELRVVRAPGGAVFVQLDTFGSDDRQSDRKVSQTVQFDRAAALELSAFIESVFGPSD
jgi:hypothetical protein